MIRNPVLPGFNPDPSIVRVGEDYYLATSTFVWQPGIRLFHSTDLATWSLIGHGLQREEHDLRGLASHEGIWAPCLTFSRSEGLLPGVLASPQHNCRLLRCGQFPCRGVGHPRSVESAGVSQQHRFRPFLLP